MYGVDAVSARRKQIERSVIQPISLDLIPHSELAEQATLLSLLINERAFEEIQGFLKAEYFFLLRHQYIYTAMLRLYKAGMPVNYVTVVTELQAMGRLNDVGGAPYITQLTCVEANSMSGVAYARLVERLALRRQVLKLSDDMKLMALGDDPDATIESILYTTHTAVLGMMTDAVERKWTTAQAALSSLLSDVEAARDRGTNQVGLSTGFPRLNKITLGFQGGQSYLVAARPGVGKSALLGTWGLNIAAQHTEDDRPRLVVFFSQEMKTAALMQRIVSSETNLNLRHVLGGNVTDDEYSRILGYVNDRGAKLQLVIDDTPGMNPARMLSVVRDIERFYGQRVDIIFEDYIQLMSGEADNRQEEVAEVSRGIKLLAMTLDIPIVSAAQLNRNVDQRQDKRPTLSDLRESGALENDADVIMFLYREDYYEDANPQDESLMELIIAKNRHGPTGTIDYFFNRAKMQHIERPA